jgi:hypothetical protein
MLTTAQDDDRSKMDEIKARVDHGTYSIVLMVVHRLLSDQIVASTGRRRGPETEASILEVRVSMQVSIFVGLVDRNHIRL